MLSDLYVPGDTVVHRARPAIKIGVLVAFCTTLFLMDGFAALGFAAILVAAGYLAAGLGLRRAGQALRPVAWVLALVFAAQLFIADLTLAIFVVGRFAVLILAASLVTLTTRSSEFVDGIMAALRYAPSFVSKDKIALAISLAFRFIPLVRYVVADIREAQTARGLSRNAFALAVPVIITVLKRADAISEAIQARSVR